MADQVVVNSSEKFEIKAHKDEDPALETDGSILASYTNGHYKLSMWIPSDLAGRVVGKKGVVISNIKTETKVELINALAPVGDSLWVAVVILGEWKSIVAAYKAVSDIVHGEVDDVVLEYNINRNKPFFIFGKAKMNVVKVVSAKSNVRIYLPELVNQKEYKQQTEPMTLEGTFENVKKAVALLEQEALQYRERYGDGFSKKLAQPLSGPPAKSSKGFEEDSKHSIVRIEARKDEHKREENKREVRDVRLTKDEKREERKPAEDTVKRDSKLSTDKATKVPEDTNKSIISTSTNSDKILKTEGKAGTVDVSADKQRKMTEPMYKVINIPSSLVGLLLSKHTLSKASVMNQIQSSTQTSISKFGTIPENPSSGKKDEVAKHDKNRRRRTTSGDSDVSSDGSDGSAESSVDSDDESVDVPDDSDAQPDSTTQHNHDKKNNNEQEFVIFKIKGYGEENVHMAFEHLDRIVKGDRIKDVMENLKVVTRNLVKRELPLVKKEREPRIMGENKGSSSSTSTRPTTKKVERKSEEKISEKDGLWRRAEKTDKYEPHSKERRNSHSGVEVTHNKLPSSEKKSTEAPERVERSTQDSSRDFGTKPDKSSEKSGNKTEKPEKQLGKFEKRVSGPPAKPYASESPRGGERKGPASSSTTDNKKSHPNKEKSSNGDKKPTVAGSTKPTNK